MRGRDERGACSVMGQYITIDGDDIGCRITRCYLSNDAIALGIENEIVSRATSAIAAHLTSIGFRVIFSAADGVTAFSDVNRNDYQEIFQAILDAGKGEITFSVGVGETLQESYIALLYSKCNGKCQIKVWHEGS